ncbi:MAG: hypothetical protein RL141_370 [Candidatus Parcubacteria bacterium]|jgi:drug/metabolite transporter (DMT)-like permease
MSFQITLVLLGVLLAVGAALTESTVDVLRKKNSIAYDAVTAAWSLHTATFAVFLPLMGVFLLVGHPFIGNAPAVPHSTDFWQAIAASVLPNILATYLYMKALETADISLVLPLVTLSSPFLLGTAFLINNEIPSWLGGIGVIVTTAGTYFLKYDGSGGWAAPFIRLVGDPASRKMLIVAGLYAISSPFDKQAVLAGGSLWSALFMQGGMALFYTPLMFRKGRLQRLRGTPGSGKWFVLLGLVDSVRAYCQYAAYPLLLTPYVIGLKRLSVIFGVLWGRFYFKEKQTGQRAFAAFIMVVGSFLIMIAAAYP